jgi:hypothetical protein
MRPSKSAGSDPTPSPRVCLVHPALDRSIPPRSEDGTEWPIPCHNGDPLLPMTLVAGRHASPRRRIPCHISEEPPCRTRSFPSPSPPEGSARPLRRSSPSPIWRLKVEPGDHGSVVRGRLHVGQGCRLSTSVLSQQMADLLRQRSFAGVPTWDDAATWKARAARICCDTRRGGPLVAEVVRLPIGMTTLQDAADAFLDQHDPARSNRRVYRASPASLVAGLSFPGGGLWHSPTHLLHSASGSGSCSRLSSGRSPPQRSAPSRSPVASSAKPTIGHAGGGQGRGPSRRP